MDEIVSQANVAQDAFLAQLQLYGAIVPEVAHAVVAELRQQRSHIKLIASENYSSLACQLAMGNWLTDKYAEGVVGKRFYTGCEQVDAVEEHAAALACKLFGAEYAYVQPHSGADANLIAYAAILTTCVEEPALAELGSNNVLELTHEQWQSIRAKLGNQRLLGPHVFSGGHLTHGYRHNISGRMFESYHYKVSPETGLLDYQEIEQQAIEVRPLILLAGYSAYPRRVNFRRMREIADKVGAVLMVDMAHFAGLVAGKVFQGDFDPVPFADVVTSTTHKTLRGPRGGLILAKKRFAPAIDRGCPLVIGGPLPHVIAAKAVAFQEALQPSFQTYAKKIIENSQALAESLQQHGAVVVSGGTENHLILVDVRPWGLNGRQAGTALLECGFTTNRNTLPNDPNGPWYGSGLRLGTAAVTSLGMGPAEMKTIAAAIAKVLRHVKPTTLTKGEKAGQLSRIKFKLDKEVRDAVRQEVSQLLERYPVYPELDLSALSAVLPELPA